MVQQIDAVYENGVLRPLQALNLRESERVRLSVSSSVSNSTEDLIDQTLLQYARARAASLDRVQSIDEVRERLAQIEGSLAELIISEGGEY